MAYREPSGQLLLLDRIPGVLDDPVQTINALGAEELARLITGEAARLDARRIDPERADFDVPVPAPQKIICVALNYATHAAEGNQEVPVEPVIFFKPPSSLLPHNATVRNPSRSRHLDHEVELGVVIGKRAKNVAAANWRDVVCGYTVVNDVTARDLQLVAIANNQPWDHTKAFDTFAPCGPYLVTPEDVRDPMQLDLSLRVDGDLRQSSNTAHMIFSIPTLIEWISRDITLEPGDIIATGTPSGISRVNHGQIMTAEVAGIGCLVNPVVYEHG
jgi:2-keto-4-pentenoate hydratase/2-oxohepta-3-ene-1,7-dioic acid hydratase in catechol pathway